MPISNDVEYRPYPIPPAASSRCRNDEHERLLLVSVGLAPVCIPVHVQEDLETGFTRQPIRWRRDGPMTKIVVYSCFVRLVWCPWASPSMFRRIPHRLYSTTDRPVARCPNIENSVCLRFRLVLHPWVFLSCAGVSNSTLVDRRLAGGGMPD